MTFNTVIHGDLILQVYYNGYHGDCSKTFPIGDVDEKGKWLLEATQTCLNAGIKVCQPGANFSDVGYAIEEKATELGYKVVPAFLGHGIGSYFHGPPEIFHIGRLSREYLQCHVT